MTFRSAFYDGVVVHERYRPRAHKLRYSVFTMLFDLDELPLLSTSLKFFAHNRWAPVAFHDCDHGRRDGTGLRAWAEGKMRDAGVEPDGGRIELLCYPRLFGYVFNPLSVYFCRTRDGALAAILYEVHNTHGEQHTYAIPVRNDGAVIEQRAEKAFYVSPFIGPTATYNFRILPPDGNVIVVIRQESAGEPLMTASFHGTRQPLSTGALLSHLGSFPLMTFKVVAAIHWEALKMWWKGFEVFPHAPQRRPSGPRT
jgi:DUF1365 family protein